MKIINLQVENIKRIKAVNIAPQNNMVVIGGKNGAGKSSILDAIMYALAGAKSLPEKTITEGHEKGQVIINVGKFVITRKFHRKENEIISTLEIKNSDGYKESSPQTLLDSLYGEMTFDPLEFSRLKPKYQVDQLKELVKLDFTELDKKKTDLYDKRTGINRQIKEKEARIGSILELIDCPKEEVSISDLMTELSKAEEANSLAQRTINRELDYKKLLESKLNEVTRVENQINQLKDLLASLGNEIIGIQKETEDFIKKSENLKMYTDTVPIKEKIKNAENINAAIRKQKERESLKQELIKLEIESNQLTSEIDAIDSHKRSLMEKAPFPVPGLGFDENGITLNGLPFQQASSAEKLRISVAMGIALNPKLKIMQIRDGSLLDNESLKLIDDMANESDMQIFLERVGEGQECSIIISDGLLKG